MTVTIKPPRAHKKPATGPLRLVVDNLSAQDKELIGYFHAMAHEVRPSALLLLRHAALQRPLVEPAAELAPVSIRLAAARST